MYDCCCWPKPPHSNFWIKVRVRRMYAQGKCFYECGQWTQMRWQNKTVSLLARLPWIFRRLCERVWDAVFMCCVCRIAEINILTDTSHCGIWTAVCASPLNIWSMVVIYNGCASSTMAFYVCVCGFMRRSMIIWNIWIECSRRLTDMKRRHISPNMSVFGSIALVQHIALSFGCENMQIRHRSY